ncbi:MAG: CpsB/CapC family capsule biosynthesis tyrosine phosphatase [Cellulophaga sp.]
MFHIFSKKKFLIDYLDGYVDMHNHILPGIDDGAKTVEDSIALLKGFSEFGVTKFIATPHIMHNYYPNNSMTINCSLAILQNELKKSNLCDFSIRIAAEHMIDSNFEDVLTANEIMPLNENHLLVEMSYLQASINFDDAIIKVASKGYFPILAHPERYGFLHNRIRKHEEYKQQGILYQMNLLSLGDFYGKEVNKTALKLLDAGLINFIASDVHNLRQLNSLKNITVSKKTIDQIIPIINNTIDVFY